MADRQIVRTQEAIDRFYLRLEFRDRSPATLNTYRSPLSKLATAAPWLPCTEDDVMRAMVLRKLSPNSKAHMLRVLRSFFAFVQDQYPGIEDPTVKIKDIKEQEVEPRVLTRKEVDRLVATARETNRQDYLLVLTFLDTMIRVGEMASITTSSFGDKFVYVHGKSGRRRAPISPVVADLLMEHADGKVIWRNELTGEPLTVDAIKKRITRVFDRAGIEGERRGPHTFRHTAATHFIEDGGDVVVLKGILGHKSLKMTLRYVTLAGTIIIEQHRLRSSALRYLGRPPVKITWPGISIHRSEPRYAKLQAPNL